MADELRYTIKADGADKAAADLDKLADKAAAIEGQTVEATVTFDTSRAEQAIARVDGDLSELSNDDKVAILRLEAKQFEREITRARRDLNDLDGEEAQARIRVIDNARANLDLIKGRLDQLDRRTVDVKVEADTQAAASRLDGLAAKIGALAGLGAALSLANDTNQAALNAQTLADALGASLEETSKLLSASRRVGIEYGDIFDIVNQVNGVLETQPELVRELGIEARTPLGRFREAFDAISAIEDPLRRNVLGAKAFGEEGVRQVGALQSAYGDYASLLNKGVAATDANVEAARKWRETVADVRSEFAETAASIVADINNIAAATGLGDDAIGGFFEKLGNAVQNRTTLGFLGNIAEALRDTSDEATAATRDVEILGDEMEVFSRAAGLTGDQVAFLSDDMEVFSGRAARTTRVFADQADSLDKVRDAYRAAREQADLYRETTERAREAVERLEQAERARIDAVFSGLDAEQAVADARERLRQATQRGGETFGELQRGEASQGEFDSAFRDEQAAIRQAAEAAGRLAEFWGADAGGVRDAQIAELNRIRSETPAQAGYIDRLIGLLQSTAAPNFSASGMSGGVVIINTGADPGAVAEAVNRVFGGGFSGYR